MSMFGSCRVGRIPYRQQMGSAGGTESSIASTRIRRRWPPCGHDQPPRLKGSGSKSCEEVPAVTHVEIAPRVPEQAGPRGPRAATEDLLGAEEGRRVFLVRIALESRIR